MVGHNSERRALSRRLPLLLGVPGIQRRPDDGAGIGLTRQSLDLVQAEPEISPDESLARVFRLSTRSAFAWGRRVVSRHAASVSKKSLGVHTVALDKWSYCVYNRYMDTTQTNTDARSKGKWAGMNWIRKEKRLSIYLRDGLACVWCGQAVEDGIKLTLDHLIPHSPRG